MAMAEDGDGYGDGGVVGSTVAEPHTYKCRTVPPDPYLHNPGSR